MLDLFDRVIQRLAEIGAIISALLVIVMTGLVGYGVVMRYVLNAPTVWTDELVSYLVVYLVMLAAAEALRHREHIAVDLLTDRLGPRGRHIVEIWGMVAVILVSVVLIQTGWGMVSFSRMVGLISEGYLAVPMYIPQLAVPLGAAMLLLAALNRLLRLFTGRDRQP